MGLKGTQNCGNNSKMLQETSYLKNFAPRAKAALNTKDGHTKCWFNLANRS